MILQCWVYLGSVIQSAEFEQSLFKKGLLAGGRGLAVEIKVWTVKPIGTVVPYQQQMGKEDRCFP